MWKKHFAAYLNSSKNCEIGKLLKQNINSHSNFEGIDGFMHNSFEVKSPLHNSPVATWDLLWA